MAAPAEMPAVSAGRRIGAIAAGLLVAAGAGHLVVGRTGRGIAWFLVSSACSIVFAGASLAGFWPMVIAAGLALLVLLASVVDVALVRARSFPGGAFLAAMLIGLFAVTRVVPIVLESAVVEGFRNPSGGMLPTLQPGDHFFIDKRAGVPSRGDVIVFDYPGDRGKSYVKRVVGLPGEEIDVRDGVVLIDGVPQNRVPTSPIEVMGADCVAKTADQLEETLSGDDESHAIIQMAHRAGSPFRGPWRVPVGELFVMGDNRDNSADSRTGFTVPADHITGRVLYVYFSWDSCRKRVRTERIGLALR